MRSRTHLVFLALYACVFATAVVWLALGLLPGLAAGSAGFHVWLHEGLWGGALVPELARNAAQASHGATWGVQTFFDYLFSAFTLGVSLLLVRLRPDDRTARLLALGMVGSAVAFDLQGHDALQVVPVDALAVVNAWHDSLHVLSGLAYTFALLTFPDGKLPLRGRRMRFLRIPVLGVVAWFVTGLGMITSDDHTVGLVMGYGVLTPIAGVAAQIARSRRARSDADRQQSTVVLWALTIALLIAAPLMILTGSVTSPQQTVSYEAVIPRAGVYYFRCDPHPADMRGVLRASTGGADEVALSAKSSLFNTVSLEVAAREPVSIDFTNHDADLHNVAIYRDRGMSDPVFIGKEFSGRAAGVTAFRVFRVVFALIPIALIVALARFRLWEMNRVVNRTLAYALVVGFVSVVYLGGVGLLGLTFGIRGRMNAVGAVIIAVVVAAIFQPVRDRARRLANRLVYGERATPYEALSEFSSRLGGSYNLEQLLPQLPEILGKATGAEVAEVWLRVDGQLMVSASWPGERDPRPIPLTTGSVLPDMPERDHVVPVSHGNELLGALAIAKPAGEEVTEIERRLMEDAASQAALALKNAQLSVELQARVEELRRSRQRILTAQDDERRRLERNIHDGAQQHLVSLSMKLALARDLTARDPRQAGAVLDELQEEMTETLEALRDLARGIHPPVLTDRGLAAAVEAHARRVSMAVELAAEGVGRYDPHIESAVYFCISEAIQNAVKHSGAEKVSVTLAEKDGVLEFRVADDGRGFDRATTESSGLRNIADRVEALTGSVTITSAPGVGTTVVGRVPLTR